MIKLALEESQEEEVIGVEDWVEIRRLHRGEGMPATVIAERIGWERLITVLKERVRERP